MVVTAVVVVDVLEAGTAMEAIRIAPFHLLS